MHIFWDSTIGEDCWQVIMPGRNIGTSVFYEVELIKQAISKVCRGYHHHHQRIMDHLVHEKWENPEKRSNKFAKMEA